MKESPTVKKTAVFYHCGTFCGLVKSFILILLIISQN
mgnify:CR=1 FL=1